jgi:predicted kinase
MFASHWTEIALPEAKPGLHRSGQETRHNSQPTPQMTCRYRASVASESTPSHATPAALVISGPPASGKSTLGALLARRVGAVLLDQDVVTGPLTRVVAGLLANDDLDSPALAAATRNARYESLIAVAEDNLRIHNPVVLVAPFTEERRAETAWQRLASRLQASGGEPLLIWLRLSPEELIARMRTRGAARDRAKLAAQEAYLAQVDLRAPVVGHVAIDAEQEFEHQIDGLVADRRWAAG